MKTIIKVFLGLLLVTVAVKCGHDHDRDYDRDYDHDDDDEWRECDEDWHCEVRDTLFNTDKTECCDGECRETCDRWWHAVLFVLLSLGCCLGCLAAIGGVVYCAAYAAYKNSATGSHDPTFQSQNAPAYAMPAYGSPPAYTNGAFSAAASAENAGPLPPKI